jgi:hypothetical protein
MWSNGATGPSQLALHHWALALHDWLLTTDPQLLIHTVEVNDTIAQLRLRRPLRVDSLLDNIVVSVFAYLVGTASSCASIVWYGHSDVMFLESNLPLLAEVVLTRMDNLHQRRNTEYSESSASSS